MPTVKVNDIQMYYEIHGEGKPLFLIGGLGLDLSELQSMSGWLAQRYQVIVFDNRGAGRTESRSARIDRPGRSGPRADDPAQRVVGRHETHAGDRDQSWRHVPRPPFRRARSPLDSGCNLARDLCNPRRRIDGSVLSEGRVRDADRLDRTVRVAPRLRTDVPPRPGEREHLVAALRLPAATARAYVWR